MSEFFRGLLRHVTLDTGLFLFAVVIAYLMAPKLVLTLAAMVCIAGGAMLFIFIAWLVTEFIKEKVHAWIARHRGG